MAATNATDARGQTIPAPLVPLFRVGRAHLERVRRHLREIEKLNEAASEKPWGIPIGPRLAEMERDCDRIEGDVAGSIPWCVCPGVGPDGRHTAAGPCRYCIGDRGWLSHWNYLQLPDAVQRLTQQHTAEV